MTVRDIKSKERRRWANIRTDTSDTLEQYYEKFKYDIKYLVKHDLLFIEEEAERAMEFLMSLDKRLDLTKIQLFKHFFPPRRVTNGHPIPVGDRLLRVSVLCVVLSVFSLSIAKRGDTIK